MPGLAEALAAQRRWAEHQRGADLPADVRIGVAASCTAQPLEPFLGAALLDGGLRAHIEFAEYNQIHEVCYDPIGALGQLDFLVILWRIDDMFPGALERAAAGDAAAVDDISAAAGDLGRTIGSAARESPLSFVVSTPTFPRPVGVDLLDSVTALRLGRVHQGAISSFLAAVGDAPIRWAGLHAWQLATGVENAHDVVKDLVYHQPFTTRFWHEVGGHLADIVLRESRPTPKCIVLDGDNTLWGGIVGEDGVGGIELGSAFPGSAYREFQKVLKSLKDRGVLLAIASKNNAQEVDDVFTQHDEMVLKPSDIAVWRVNWGPKSQSLREIAAELNIGTDALVMIDDSNYEVAEISNAVPEVRVLQVPEETGLLPDLIGSSGLFRNMKVSAEDLARTDMILQESAREQAAHSVTREEFLASLELTLDYLDVDESRVGRAAQLTNKTNQFNLTTIRRTEAEIRALISADDHIVRAIRVSDRFGDYGLVGLAVVDTAGRDWTIDTFLMSCRVLSRGVETAFLAALAAEAAGSGAAALVGRYVPTQKNVLVKDLYPQHGFTDVGDGVFRAEPGQVAAPPPHIAVDTGQRIA